MQTHVCTYVHTHTHAHTCHHVCKHLCARGRTVHVRTPCALTGEHAHVCARTHTCVHPPRDTPCTRTHTHRSPSQAPPHAHVSHPHTHTHTCHMQVPPPGAHVSPPSGPRAPVTPPGLGDKVRAMHRPGAARCPAPCSPGSSWRSASAPGLAQVGGGPVAACHDRPRHVATCHDALRPRKPRFWPKQLHPRFYFP